MFCRNYVKRRRNDNGLGRPSFRSASVALRGAGFGDSSNHALKVSNILANSTFSNRRQIRRIRYMT